MRLGGFQPRLERGALRALGAAGRPRAAAARSLVVESIKSWEKGGLRHQRITPPWHASSASASLAEGLGEVGLVDGDFILLGGCPGPGVRPWA